MAAGSKVQDERRKEGHCMSVTQTRCDDSFSVEPSRMLQMIELGFRLRARQTRELMYHTLGAYMENGTRGGIQGGFGFAESLMSPHCDPLSQPRRNPIS